MSATPTKIDNNGIELIKSNNDLTITLTPTNGLDIEYDLNSTPKEFKLNENGVYWTNGVDTFQTSLNRLCAVEQAFQAVELPPNPTTLQLNNTLFVTDGVSNNATLNDNSLTLTDNASDSATYFRNFVEMLYNGGDQEIFLSNAPSNQRLLIKDQVTSNSTTLTNSSLTFNDGSFTPSIGIAGGDLVIDGQTARILLNSGNNEFYIGEYSAGTAPVIISTGSGSMSLIMNSRSGVAKIGDCDNAFNNVKVEVDDANQIINIDNGGDAVINIGDINGGGNATKLIVNDNTTTFTIDFPTINFQNTTTTTSSSTHNANIKSTSSGLESTTFLKVKLNGTDIWIPYFTTDPSL